MKLLLDENISRRIVAALQTYHAGSSHVVLEGLASASDKQVWDYARANDFVIVSKDNDFVAMSALLGHPPKLIRLSLGNCSNDKVLDALTTQASRLQVALSAPETSLVELMPDES